MGKRFAILIGVAAAGVMALGAQTAAASDIHTHSTKLTLVRDRCCIFHGSVKSEVRKCGPGRRVTLFKQRPGADRRLGTTVSGYSGNRDAAWGVYARAHDGDRMYAKVERRVRKSGDVCFADRSKTLTYPDSG